MTRRSSAGRRCAASVPTSGSGEKIMFVYGSLLPRGGVLALLLARVGSCPNVQAEAATLRGGD